MYKLALVNHADPKAPAAKSAVEPGTPVLLGNDDQWLICRSVRRERAIEQARKILSGEEPLFRKVDGKGDVRVKTSNVMLFHVLEDGTLRPVSLKHREVRLSKRAERMRQQGGTAAVGQEVLAPTPAAVEATS